MFMKVSTMPDPPPVSYSDKVGYRDNVDDIEALASRAMSPISDFPPGDDYDEEDHSITSSDEDEDHGDMSLSDEEGQRDATALRKKTSDILNEFEGFVKDVNESSSTSMEIMNTLTWTRGDTVKSRITSGGGDAALNREWSREERNLHDIRFGSNDDDYSSGGDNKYEKRRFFKYAIPFFHSKKFKAIAAGVAVVLVLMVIVGSVSSTSDREDVGEMNGVVMVEDFEDSGTVSIDTSTCEDHPTAKITPDGHTCEDFIAHVGRVPLHNARCSHESPLRNEKGEPLLVKEVCRLSCGMCGDAWTQGPQEGDAGMPQAQVESPATVDSPPQDTMPSSLGTAQAQSNAFETKPVELVSPPSSATAQVEPVPSQSIQQTQESSNTQIPEKTTENTVINTNNLSIQSKPASVSGLPEQQAYNFVGKRYEPVWFDRSSGWQGTTYEAAVQFCLSLEQNRILCPYEAYCPLGPHTEVPFGGFRDGGAWAPAINSREWWVQVGHTENTCKHANFDQNWGQDGSNEEQTRNIMCCLYEN
mmetsp:Transcript_9305/g.15401  ORF Transcript_9305/g.15401 Transcript_9305/m.15401 type:complete len:530 (+) Transcript_9305:2-1591(+)